MHHIIIDARNTDSLSGEYIGQLLDQLQVVDKNNKYTILVKDTDKNHWKPTESNFSIKSVNFNNSFFNEQFRLKKILNTLYPDLVHFYTPRQPFFYKGRHITTLYDLADIPGLSQLKLSRFSQLIKNYILKNAILSSKYIIVSNSYIKKELLKVINTPVDKIAVIPFDTVISTKTSQDFWHQTALQTHSVYIDAIRDHFSI